MQETDFFHVLREHSIVLFVAGAIIILVVLLAVAAFLHRRRTPPVDRHDRKSSKL